MARLAFLSCHLSGTGHLVRVLTLARAAAARGHQVLVLNGGRRLEHLSADGVAMIDLPPVTIRGLEFGVLRRPDGMPVDEGYMAARGAAIAAALADHQPDALITELFPFGRRVLSGEFLSAIETARQTRADAAILCSVRDVPEPKPKRLAGVAARLTADYDGVLVHGDARFLPLSRTWPLPDDLAPMVHHTGYVGRSMPQVARGQTVLVSCGGGVLGRQLTELAVRAAAHSERPWHVLIGGADAAQVIATMKLAGSASNLTIEPVRPDFPALLAGAACSISLCGYNTAVELLQCQTPAILVPSTEAGDQEQSLRAEAFSALPGFQVLDAAGAMPDLLARMADDLAAGPPRAMSGQSVDTGQGAIDRIERILQERTGS